MRFDRIPFAIALSCWAIVALSGCKPKPSQSTAPSDLRDSSKGNQLEQGLPATSQSSIPTAINATEVIERDPIELWNQLDQLNTDWRALKTDDFLKAAEDLIQVRKELGKRKDLQHLTLVAKVEDVITFGIVSRLRDGTLASADAKRLCLQYRKPVFDVPMLAELLGYQAVDAQGRQRPVTESDFAKISTYAVEQSGGEDRLFGDVPSDVTESWYFLNEKKPIFPLIQICAAVRHRAALEAYLTFLDRGGDVAAKPLYKHIQTIIPDVLKQTHLLQVGSGIEELDAGDVEAIARGELR